MAVIVHDASICAVRFGGEHSRAEAPLPLGPPAMQEDESRAIGIEQKMVEIVFCAAEVGVRVRDICHVGDGDYEFLAARFEVEAKYAGILRCQVVCVRVGQSCVAVARSHILDTPEIRCDGGSAVGAYRIERLRQCPLFARVNIKNVANESLAISVVPDNFPLLVAGRGGPPLEHTALLPTPCAGFAELYPVVPVFQIDHTNTDNVVWLWAAMLEVNLHSEGVAAGRIELQLVVVTEPMELRPPGYGPDTRKLVARGTCPVA